MARTGTTVAFTFAEHRNRTVTATPLCDCSFVSFRERQILTQLQFTNISVSCRCASSLHLTPRRNAIVSWNSVVKKHFCYLIVYREPVFNVWGIYYCYSAPRAGNNLIQWCNSRCVSSSPPCQVNAWLRHSICSFVCRFLQAACEVGSSQQESKPSAVPGLILLLYAFSY